MQWLPLGPLEPLSRSTHMLGSRAKVQIQPLSPYVARNVRIDSESSKLLILSPHSDTISDLEDVLGASASFQLSMISTW